MNARRDFFAKLLKPKANEEYAPFAPFFNKTKATVCETCADATCVESCPQNIIVRKDGGMPTLSFSSTGCTFCGDCAAFCASHVFGKENSAKISATFIIDEISCMAWNKSLCSSCLEPCLEKAIKFQWLFFPQIDMSKCSSCGFCVSRCPTSAIKIQKACDE